MSRTIIETDIAHAPKTMMLGLTGGPHSGKTFSALRLATGMVKVLGGDIWVIDTENYTTLDYSSRFTFKHLNFEPPFHSEDYLDFVEHAIANGAGAIIIDSMTHEHNGIGGVLERYADFMEERCGNDWVKQKKMTGVGWEHAKAGRKRLYNRLAYVVRNIPVLMTFKAKDAGSFLDKDNDKDKGDKGQKADTTIPLLHDLKINFLMASGSEGHPIFASDKQAERDIIRIKDQFAGWFPPGKPVQLDETLGERFGRWMLGPNAEKAPAPSAEAPPSFDPDNPLNIGPHDIWSDDCVAALDNAKTRAELKRVMDQIAADMRERGLRKGDDIIAPISAARHKAEERLHG
jgi:hypothetical protein